MNDHILRADPAAWKLALEDYAAAGRAFKVLGDAADAAEIAGASSTLCDAEDTLLSLRAPDLEAVIQKLFILWQGELHEEIDEGLHKCGVIGDLRRIITLGE